MIQTIGKVIGMFFILCAMSVPATAQNITPQLELNMGYDYQPAVLQPKAVKYILDDTDAGILHEMHNTFNAYNSMFSTETCVTNFLKKSLWCEFGNPLNSLLMGQ